MHSPSPISIRRTFFMALASVALASILGACGGGDKDSGASIRLVNATQSFASLDAFVDDVSFAKELKIGQASNFTDVSSGSRTIKVRNTGGATNLLEQSQSLNGDGHYSVIAVGGENAISLSIYKEDESEPGSGYAKFRVFNASTFGDSVDVYLTSADADLASETPVFTGIAKQSTAAFRSIATGTYRLRITTAGDRSEVRLDVAQITVSEKAIYTYVLIPTKSGTLVNGLMLQQNGGASANTNTYARVKFVNGYSSTVSAQPIVDGQKLGSAVGGYGVSSYALVKEGTPTLGFTAGGQTFTKSVTVTAGTDMTVAVTPNGATTGIISTLDNNFPVASSGKSKVRLFNLAQGAGSVQLSYNSGTTLVDYLDFGLVSGYSQFYAATYDFTVTGGSGASLTLTDYVAADGGVYTAFVFGAAGMEKFSIRRDR
jgi:hypothetical protein